MNYLFVCCCLSGNELLTWTIDAIDAVTYHNQHNKMTFLIDCDDTSWQRSSLKILSGAKCDQRQEEEETGRGRERNRKRRTGRGRSISEEKRVSFQQVAFLSLFHPPSKSFCLVMEVNKSPIWSTTTTTTEWFIYYERFIWYNVSFVML